MPAMTLSRPKVPNRSSLREGQAGLRACEEHDHAGSLRRASSASVTEVLLSTLVFTCETCGNHAAHQLTKPTRKFSLFFIPLFSVGTKYLDSCTACGRIIEVSKEQAEAAARQVGPDLR